MATTPPTLIALEALTVAANGLWPDDLLLLYNLETGEDRFISQENSVLGWSFNSRYLYSRFRDRVFQ